MKFAEQCIIMKVFWNYKNLSKSTTGFLLPCLYLWNDLGDSVFDGVGLAWFKNMANAFLSA